MAAFPPPPPDTASPGQHSQVHVVVLHWSGDETHIVDNWPERIEPAPGPTIEEGELLSWIWEAALGPAEVWVAYASTIGLPQTPPRYLQRARAPPSDARVAPALKRIQAPHRVVLGEAFCCRLRP